MAREEMPTSWAESPYLGPISSLSDQQWVSPRTTYANVSHAYSSHPNPALLTPISACHSVYLDPRQSPPQQQQSHDLQYQNITTTAGASHGLGISSLAYMQPGIALYDPHGQNPYDPHSHIHMRHLERPGSDRASRSGAGSLSARSTPVTIAPNPLGIKQIEHERRSGQELESHRQTRRTRRPRRRSSILDEETNLTLQLREQNIPWNEVVKRVNAAFGGNHNASRLQMRITRLKQRMREWSEDDIRALRNAHSYWESDKFDIIARKMQDYKTTRGWTASQCQQKWQEIHTEPSGTLRRERSPGDEPPGYPSKKPQI